VNGAPANFDGVNGELYGILYAIHIVAGGFGDWRGIRFSTDLGYSAADRPDRKGCARCAI